MQAETTAKSCKAYLFGDWYVDTESNTVSRDGVRRQIEPRAMDVLAFLCRRPNEVLSAEEILTVCWGNAIQGDNQLHKVFSQLRKALGDVTSAPRYIETIRKRGYRAIVEVARAGPALPAWREHSPFRGLESFQLEHAAVFRGRDAATDALTRALLAQRSQGCAFVLVLGPSGSGKTSLIQAGLLARLMNNPAPDATLVGTLTLDCADIGDASLLDALGSVLIDAEVDGRCLFEGESTATLGERLARDMPAVEARLRERLGGIALFLFVDRLEASLRGEQHNDGMRAAFLHCIEQLGRCGVFVVAACRNDFYPQLMTFPAMGALKARGGQFDLSSPNPTEIAQMIRLPAQAAGLHFEIDDASGSRLDGLLCQAAQGGADVLPLLEYCLHELYRRRGADGMLTLQVFRDLGGIEGAISARAEEVIATLSQAEVDALPRVLSQLVNVSDELSTVTARRAPWAGLSAGPEQQLVRALVDARLFVTDLAVGRPSFGVAHEALLRCWPRATEWIDKHRHALQLQTRIGAQAQRWQASGRAPDLLLPAGIQTRQAEALMQMPELGLQPLERDYIVMSLCGVRRLEKLRLLVTLSLAALTVAAILLGLAAFAAQQRGERHRMEAEDLLTFMLGELADKVRPLGRLDLLDSVSERALHYLSDTSRLEEQKVALTQRTKALQLIAEVKIARGDSSAARKALLAAREILERQHGLEPANQALLAGLGANAFWLGQIDFDQNQWESARRHFDDYARFADRLAALAPADPGAWIEQSYAQNSLGSVALKRGDTAAAVRAFSASVELKARALARKGRDTALVADLADSISWLASATEQRGDLDGAMRLLQREQSLLQGLQAAAPGDGVWRHRYALALWHQADLDFAQGAHGAGLARMSQSEQLLRELVRLDPSNRDWQTDADNAELKLIEARIEGADPARLDALYRNFSHHLKHEPKKIVPARLMGAALTAKAAVQLAHGQHREAAATLALALTSLGRLYTATPFDPKLRETLAAALLLQASIARQAGDDSPARLACGQVAHMLSPSIEHSLDFRALAAWVSAQHCLRTPERAAAQRKRLQHIGYRDARYLATIFSTTAPKGLQ